jgi:hypothetical protein
MSSNKRKRVTKRTSKQPSGLSLAEVDEMVIKLGLKPPIQHPNIHNTDYYANPVEYVHDEQGKG